MTRIAVLTLGGTIAMRDQGAGALPALGPAELLDNLGLNGEGIEIVPEAVANVPSGHLTLDDVYGLARRVVAMLAAGADGVVVTQGTDTLEETAFALDLLLSGLLLSGPAPVVVTGAMRAASALAPDGPANLRAAILTAAAPEARGRGVLVVMNDTIHAAAAAVKTHTQALDAFRSYGGGPLGAMVEGGARFYATLAPLPSVPLPEAARSRVVLLKTYLGDDGALVAMLGAVDGLVVEGLGGGHVSPAFADRLQDLAARVPVILATRCAEGRVLTRTYAYPGSEIDLIGRGLIPAGALSGVKARLALAILLDGGATRAAVTKFFAAC